MACTAATVAATPTPLRSSFLPRPVDQLLLKRYLQNLKTNRRWSRQVRRLTVTAQFMLPKLPYSLDALEPHMSQQTLEYHWKTLTFEYLDNLNKQIAGTELEMKALEDIIRTTYNNGDILPVFNVAAEFWNHNFFWHSMKPNGGGKPSGILLHMINRDFGSFENFAQEFKSAAATQFGSGWAWLVYKSNTLKVEDATDPRLSEDRSNLEIVKTQNAVNPLVWDQYPLLAIDVWEHAYFLDFQNRRADYISVFMEKLVSWDWVSSNLEAAMAGDAARQKTQ